MAYRSTQEMIQDSKRSTGFVANLLDSGFEYGYGTIWYVPKLAATIVPFSIAYLPALGVDNIIKNAVPGIDRFLDCRLLGNNCIE